MKLSDRIAGMVAGGSVGAEALGEALDQVDREVSAIRESDFDAPTSRVREDGLSELELAQDDFGWREILGPGGRWNFTRIFLRKIMTLSRVMYLINPLIRRAVTVQELYVWGGGVSIEADDPTVQEVLDDFFEHPRNQKVVGEAWPEREREQRIDGNTVLVMHINKRNGMCRARTLNVDWVETIYHNPEDYSEAWFYKKTWAGDSSGPILFPDAQPTQFAPVWIPDIDYNPKSHIRELDGFPVDWSMRVLHQKSGGLSLMWFGIPELYSCLGWATGYKRILENFATILQAYARIAMKLSGLSGKKGVAASKSKIQTSVSAGATRDTNPPANTASWALLSGNTNVEPIKTAGHTTGPDEARALRSMVAAGSDTPEHFFGDSDIGNFATSSTLDRPTELKMVSRQKMWTFFILRICRYLIEISVRAPFGKLQQAGYKMEVAYDPFDDTPTVKIIPPEGKSSKVTVTFPNILQRDVTDRVRAVVQAATLGGSPAEGIIPDRGFLFKLLMTALGEQDAKTLMEKYYPEPVTQGFADPKDRITDEHLIALGRKELGDAALQQADAAKKNAGKPKPSGSPAPGASSSSK